MLSSCLLQSALEGSPPSSQRRTSNLTLQVQSSRDDPVRQAPLAQDSPANGTSDWSLQHAPGSQLLEEHRAVYAPLETGASTSPTMRNTSADFGVSMLGCCCKTSVRYTSQISQAVWLAKLPWGAVLPSRISCQQAKMCSGYADYLLSHSVQHVVCRPRFLPCAPAPS